MKFSEADMRKDLKASCKITRKKKVDKTLLNEFWVKVCVEGPGVRIPQLYKQQKERGQRGKQTNKQTNRYTRTLA